MAWHPGDSSTTRPEEDSMRISRVPAMVMRIQLVTSTVVTSSLWTMLLMRNVLATDVSIIVLEHATGSSARHAYDTVTGYQKHCTVEVLTSIFSAWHPSNDAQSATRPGRPSDTTDISVHQMSRRLEARPCNNMCVCHRVLQDEYVAHLDWTVGSFRTRTGSACAHAYTLAGTKSIASQCY